MYAYIYILILIFVYIHYYIPPAATWSGGVGATSDEVPARIDPSAAAPRARPGSL